MQVNILGFGVMGRQIVALLYKLGFEVFVYTKHANMKEFELETKIIEKKLALKDSKNGIITFCQNLNELPESLCIECLSEDLELKKQNIEAFMANHNSTIFSNSSSYSSKDLGCGLFHFLNPIYLKLVEIYDPKNESIKLKTALENAEFTFIQSKGNRGSIVNLILFSEISTFFKMIEMQGYTLKECQIVYDKIYNGRNLLTIINTIGIDVCAKICQNINEEDKNFYLPKSFDKAMSMGILGRKNKTKIEEILQ